jgi:hypothetical protein
VWRGVRGPPQAAAVRRGYMKSNQEGGTRISYAIGRLEERVDSEWQLLSPERTAVDFFERASRHGTSAAGMPHSVMLGMGAFAVGSRQAHPLKQHQLVNHPRLACITRTLKPAGAASPPTPRKMLLLRLLLTQLRCSPPARPSHQMGDYRGVSSQARLLQAKNVVEPAEASTTAGQGCV